MTVVINYASKRISVIATDTRGVIGKDGGALGEYSDDKEKLIELKSGTMGWTAGAGAGLFLDDVKNKLANLVLEEEVPVEIFMDIYRDCFKHWITKNDYPEKDIQKSVISFSYLGVIEQNFSMRIGILTDYLLSTPTTFSRVPNNKFCIFYPNEYLNNLKLVDELEDKYLLKHEFNDDLNKILLKVLLMFNEMRYNSDSVSSVCDIGIHIIEPTGIFKFRIRDEAKALIKDIELGTIANKMDLVNQILFSSDAE